MMLIGYKIPETYQTVFQDLANGLNVLSLQISSAEELNFVDEKKNKYLISFSDSSAEKKELRLKCGLNAKYIWCKFSETGKADIIFDPDSEPENFYLTVLKDDPAEFKRQMNRIIGQKENLSSGKDTERLYQRLSLIRELTQKTISLENECEIRSFLLKRLFDFYDANSCSFLNYNSEGVLELTSQVKKSGEYLGELHIPVENPEDYEECVQCNDPVINCKISTDSGTSFLCAPVMAENRAAGMVRINYNRESVDIAIDRTVLRIAADILGAAMMRQKSADQLKESEHRASTVDAIITINERGIINSFNQAAERLFEYKASEVTGKNVSVLMPAPYRQEHDEYIDHYKKTGERQIIGIGREVRGRRKSGSVFPMYLAVSEYYVNERRMFTGIIRDMTEERRLEQEVMRISEHERHRIGQDLHDGLGQMLSGHILKKLKKEEHALTEDMQEIADLIKEADEYSRGLARGLVKIDLDRGGFHAAIEKLVRQSERLFRITCTLNAPEEIEITEHNSAENVYRIIQEAINNAVKHGQSTKVTVNMVYQNKAVRITIQDNGTGFPRNWRHRRGLGVRIMEFRARLIGGHFEQRNRPGGGASISILLPEYTL